METIILKAHQIIERLKFAIRQKDENQIVKAHERGTKLNWAVAPIYLYEEYRRLTDKANEILITN